MGSLHLAIWEGSARSAGALGLSRFVAIHDVIPTTWEPPFLATGHKAQDTNPSTPSPPGSVPVVHAILRHPMACRDKPGNDGRREWGAFTSPSGRGWRAAPEPWGSLDSLPFAMSFPRQWEPPFQATGHRPQSPHPVTTGLVPVVHGILRHSTACRHRRRTGSLHLSLGRSRRAAPGEGALLGACDRPLP